MNSIKEENRAKENCACTTDRGLYIPQRQVSALVAATILAAATVFTTGYFYGKKEVIERISDVHEDEAFADQLYTAFNQGYTKFAPQESNQDDAQTPEPLMDGSSNKIMNASESTQPHDLIVPTEQNSLYHAQLIGFGTERAAQQCAKKMEKKGFPVLVKTRHSVNYSKGKDINNASSYVQKKISWYQVVTKSYKNRAELEQLVDRITKEEKLIGVNIVIS